MQIVGYKNTNSVQFFQKNCKAHVKSMSRIKCCSHFPHNDSSKMFTFPKLFSELRIYGRDTRRSTCVCVFVKCFVCVRESAENWVNWQTWVNWVNVEKQHHPHPSTPQVSSAVLELICARRERKRGREKEREREAKSWVVVVNIGVKFCDWLSRTRQDQWNCLFEVSQRDIIVITFLMRGWPCIVIQCG